MPAPKEGEPRAVVLSGPEGRILLVGLTLAFLYIAWLGSSFLFVPERFQAFVGMTATHVLFGRAAGMAFGYAFDFGHAVVVPVNLMIEATMVLLFYPLFVLSWQRLLVFKALDNLTQRIHEAAEANRDTLRRYGIPGLFLFVLFPFWMTGPLVGCVIGHLLGLRPWLNLAIVLGGTSVATLAWAVLLKELHERVAAYSPFGPMILVAIVVVVVVASHLLEWRRREGDPPGQ